ncbi:MAG: bifunctional pyr operon transcriptional regulator/uracil phosphoribosyltransferase PyrR [Elusimicrobiota bacterium]
MEERRIIDSEKFKRKVIKLSSEILDDSQGARNLALIGIRSAGAYFAQRIAESISTETSQEIPVGLLDISLYRDDFFKRPLNPSIKKTVLDFDITGKHVVLVDDVIWTGRTVRAALDHMVDFGRPAKVRLCVLIDRGGRELPIQPDFKGMDLTLPPKFWLCLNMREAGGRDEVLVTRRKTEKADS